MDSVLIVAIISTLSSFIGVLIGGIISYLLQKQNFKHQLEIIREENKTISTAEKTIRYYLLEEDKENKYERSFDHFKTKLPGFSDDELRKILVRSGAVRFIRKRVKNPALQEWWCHVERLPYKYKKDYEKRLKNKRKAT